jgi:predicted alpha-1,2-mannosidase
MARREVQGLGHGVWGRVPPVRGPGWVRGPRWVRSCVVGLVLGLATGCGPLARRGDVISPHAAPASVLRFVDPFIGTAAHGHTYPGATVPFGMVQLSPDNGLSGWDYVSGYHRPDSLIVGFSHTHLSGTGIGDLEDILFMPTTAPVDPSRRYPSRAPEGLNGRYGPADETAKPGYYRVRLHDPDIVVELTAGTRVGWHRYTFPAGSRPTVVVDLGFAENWDTPTETHLRLRGDTLVTGYRFSKGWADDERIWFAARFSRAITGMVLADSASRLTGDAATGRHVRAALSFAGGAGTLVAKVAISYVDQDGALANMAAEAPGWDFDAARRAASAAWARELGRVRIATRDTALARTFYTALYHTKLAPITFQDVDHRYRGADGKVHTADGYDRYSIYSLWDTFRAEQPLFTILDPERVSSMVRTMLEFQRESGYLPVWSLVGNETNTMTGYHAVPVIVDAYLKGVSGFDPRQALRAMEVSADRDTAGLGELRHYGYIPSELESESVTKTLEYAYDDWAIARMARVLGQDSVYRRFLRLSGAWQNVFDPSTGFMRGRYADARWATPFDPRHSGRGPNIDFTEGDAWQYTWYVPQDERGLIRRMGGDARFIAKLDSLFVQDTTMVGGNVPVDISGLIGQYAHGNEPSHHIAYLYDYAGAPWKTADRVRRIMGTLYNDSDAGLPGNDDCGQISAWYVFSALGFYPVNPVGGVYALGSPLFPEASIDVGGGHTFRVVARGVSDANRYIESATLDGRPYSKSYITQDDLVAGGTLALTMGPTPGAAWGTAPSDRPPSQSDSGPAPVPAIHPDPTPPEMADSVRAAFVHAWDGYRQYAWGHDRLEPLSHGAYDWYGHSLLMTPVDAFDTMKLMGLDSAAADAKQLILRNLSFDRDTSVEVFEVTIRLVGGLLSAYELDGDSAFLRRAHDLAHRLLPAFRTATGMPYRFVNLHTGRVSDPDSNPAEIGTLMLEFGTLSRLTGDSVYYDVAKRAVTALFDHRSKLGLVGSTIDVRTGEWKDPTSHISGGIDSYYEYLLKSWLLFGDPDFKRMWDATIGPVNAYLADTRFHGLWYGQANMDTGARTGTHFGALDAFFPAVLVLGGDTARAEKLMSNVYRMWMTFDLEPEVMDYSNMSIVYPGYPLRPEAMESAYYLWHFTHNERYRDMGRDMFRRIVRWARVDDGFASFADVRTKKLRDQMPSFFLAETLKYAYLLFAPDSTLDFDHVIFNTEAHPLRR